MVGNAGTLYGAAFSPDGPLIATATTDGAVNLWEASSGRMLRHWQVPDLHAWAQRVLTEPHQRNP